MALMGFVPTRCYMKIPDSPVRSQPSASTARPLLSVPEAEVASVVRELDAWAHDVAGRRRLGAMQVAQQVGEALTARNREVWLDAKFGDLIAKLPPNVLALVQVRTEPQTTRLNPVGQHRRQVEQPAQPPRVTRKRNGDSLDAGLQPPARRRRTDTSQPQRVAAPSESLRQRASDMILALGAASDLMRSFRADAVDFMSKRTPPLLLGHLMHRLNEALPLHPWPALGKLLEEVRAQSNRGTPEQSQPEDVRELLTLARNFCSDVHAVMSCMDVCVDESEVPHVMVSAIFTGLRGLTLSGVMKMDPTSEDRLRNLFQRAIDLALANDGMHMRLAQAHGIASSLNGMKEGVGSQVLLADSATVKACFRLMMGLISSDSFEKPNAQSIANCMNGVRCAMDNGVLNPRDPSLHAALKTLMKLAVNRAVFKPNAQELVNFLSGMASAVAKGTLDPNDAEVKEVLNLLMAMVTDANIFVKPGSQHVANIWTCARVLLECHAFAPTSAELKAALSRLVELVGDVSTFTNPSSEEMANTLQGMHAVLEMGALKPDDAALRRALSRLVRMLGSEEAYSAPSEREIRVCLESLQAVLKLGALPPGGVFVKEALQRLERLRANGSAST